ncbi:MAG: hypothetical protein RH859_03390 [Longimicrobiales bacterium]
MTRLSLGDTDHLWGDARGWGLRPLEAAGVAPERLAEMHVVSVEPGAVRGNHRHPATTEWMLVFGAPADVASRTPDGPVEVERVDGGAPALLEFGPGVAHAVRGCGPGVTYLVCWADGTPETDRVEPLL